MSAHSSRAEPLAIVGLGALFPGSTDVHGFWRDIVAGKDQLTEIPPAHWLIEDYYDPDPKAPDKTYARRGGFIQEVPFDPLEHGMPPNVIPATDTSQLLGLIVAKKLLDDATRGGKLFPDAVRERTSVILGITSAQELLVEMGSRLQRPVWVRALREQGLPEAEVQKICDRIAGSYTPWQENTFPGLLGNVVAGRIANRLNLGGTNCVVDAACASTFGALAMGAQELYLGSSDLVITGGVETFNDIFMFMCFSKTTALSFSGDCRPFDSKSDGTMLGEGIGLVALRRLADAERDGNPIYAVLKGIGSSSDGRSKSIYAPVSSGQAKALRRAYEAAGYGPDTVELVEAHGTGTKAGDAAEFEGLRAVFDASGREDRQWCALGSIKSQIGHTKAAAGAAGLIKATLALQHRVLPPTLKVERPNPALGLEESPFHLAGHARPWIRDGSHPRRASVSSFGFGGSNFHLTLEEYRGPARAPRTRAHLRAELVALSAASAGGLLERIASVNSAIAAGRSLAAVARDAANAFSPDDDFRLAVVAASGGELVERLGAVSARVDGPAFFLPDGTSFGRGPKPEGSIAFLFPGQGSQAVGMGADLALSSSTAIAAWDEAAAWRFQPPSGHPLAAHDVAHPRPAYSDEARAAQSALLTATEWAQPALGVASVATLRALRALAIDAQVFAGHSFGEVTALHAAGAFSFESLIRIARKRGELMRDAASATPGAMWAVSLSSKGPEQFERDLAAAGAAQAGVVVANWNSRRQAVLAGPTDAVERVARQLSGNDYRATRLPVATAFHSPIVAPSVEPFAAYLDGVSVAPHAPVFANATAAPYDGTEEAVRRTLAAQIASPVRFSEEVEALYAHGVRTFVEVGPGAVLTGLVQDTLGDRAHAAIATDRRNANGWITFLAAVGRLATGGHVVALDGLFAGTADPPDRETPKPHAVMLSGTNFAKPYPPRGGVASLPPPNPARPEFVSQQPPAARPASITLSPPPPPRVHGDAPPALAAAAAPASDALGVFGEIQRQTAETHAAFQKSMAEAHLAFLRTAEAAMSALGGTGDFVDFGFGAPSFPAPQPSPVATVEPLPPAPLTASQPVLRAVAPVHGPATRGPASSTGPDVRAALVAIVSEKTGYPADMIGLDMEIEADLGIDSIKRVEILSAVQERVPGLPAVAASELGSLRTLAQILVRFGAGAAPQPAAPATPAAPSPPPPVEPSIATPASGLEQALTAVVAEKTGYPADMIGLDMEIEADLGIDSIKRVEILSAVQDRTPGLPSIPAAELGALRTLRQVLERFGAPAAVASSRPGPPAAAGVPRTSPPIEPRTELRATLVGVVAEKTGYPADMIGLEMEIESDLGIDSIKRVEILSAVQDRVPGLPAIPAAELGSLRTLRQILERFESTQGPAVDSPAVPAAPSPRTEPESLPVFVERRVLAPASGLIGVGLAGTPISIIANPTADGRALADAVVARLRDRGLDAATASEDTDARAIIDLTGLSPVESPDDGIRIQKSVFRRARDVARRSGDGSGAGAAFVVCYDASSAPSRAWLGGLPGLLRTLALEAPNVTCRAIEVPATVAGLADAVAREVSYGGPSRDVRVEAEALRTVARFETRSIAVESARRTARENPVLIVSGGARGVTARCLVELARSRPVRLAVLGRTEAADAGPEWSASARAGATDADLQRSFIDWARARGESAGPAQARAAAAAERARREIQTTLHDIRALGSQVRHFACDVRSREDVRRAVDATRAHWGRIDGVVHAAGALHDRRLIDKTDAQFDDVFDTKVAGARWLLDALADDSLETIVFFGSVAGRIGNPGQADYAMANETLERLAAVEAARRPGALVRVLHWGPWDGGMVTPALRQMFQSRGVDLIPAAAGARAFVDALDSREPVSCVVGARPDASVFLGSGSSARAVSADVVISERTFPQIADHAVNGVPVVPVAIACELFARLAREARPDLSLAALKDVRVLRGIRLPSFASGGEAFHLSCRQVANGSGATLDLLLSTAEGVPCYRAQAIMAEHRPDAPAAVAVPSGESPWSLDEAYARFLFHGPAFRAIRELLTVSPRAAGAVVARTSDASWPGAPFETDPLAVDAALQLAILCGAAERSRVSLPTAIEEISWHGTPGETAGPLTCALEVAASSELRMRADARLVDAHGRVAIALRGIEMHFVDGLPVGSFATPASTPA